MVHNPNSIFTAGVALEEATKVMVMIHGRGSSAENILSLSQFIDDKSFAFVAPAAEGNTWYPYSFLRPIKENEPYVSSALAVLTSLRARLQSDYNFELPQIYWMGFSQGACLLLEFIAQHATEYGGVFGLSGGLLGPSGTTRDYNGFFENTPIFLGCSDVDAYVPKERVLETATIFEQMGARVTTKLYSNFAHAINEDELNVVNLLIAGA